MTEARSRTVTLCAQAELSTIQAKAPPLNKQLPAVQPECASASDLHRADGMRCDHRNADGSADRMRTIRRSLIRSPISASQRILAGETQVARQHAGITGQVENCQTVVNCAYVTARGHALFDFRLYLPKAWCRDRGGTSGRRSPATWRSRPRLSWPGTWSAGMRSLACRSPGWPAMKCTAAPRSCAGPARTPGRGMCSRFRPASRPGCRPGGRSRSRRWPG